MTTTIQNTTAENFIFEMTIISPVTEIINNLEKGIYRDCDVEWLNNKLTAYTKLSLEVIGKKIEFNNAIEGDLNDYNKARFISYFTTVLNLFRSI